MKKITNKDTQRLERLYNQNKLEELEKETKNLLKIEKDNYTLLNILGVVSLKKNKFDDAEVIFKKILSKNSKNTNALKNLAELYKKSKKISLAIKYYEFFLSINKDDNEVLNNLASCYLKNKKYKLAIDTYKDLIKKYPNNEEYLINLADALISALHFEEGFKILEEILNKNIENKRALSLYLFNQNYYQKINLEKIENYLNKFKLSKKKNTLSVNNYTYSKKPKKINIGFVSPDFRNHPVGYAIANLISHLKKFNFNLFAYYNFNLEDNLTKKFKNDFNNFSNISNLSDGQVVNKILSDGIHILIDLAGYTNNNRLSIFFFNPAPIQISWLGYLPTTGINEIHYKIGDPHIYPPLIEKNFTEKILRLPKIWSDFKVRENINLNNPLINARTDHIIFGCFVTLRKINDDVIKLWSKVLKKFLNTKIYFKSPELNDSWIEDNFKNKFLKHGVDSDRLILEKSSDYESYMKSYSKVHISLDPFPWNSVTTAFESIWMGVPIFCLKGQNLPYSRCSYSINVNLKMHDWIANNENEYFQKLEKILSDKDKLIEIKKNLRENAKKNNLFNSEEFANNFANLLNQSWNNFLTE